MYFLFSAAEKGCLACVRQLIEKEGVDASSQSLTNKYTALDFAEWFQSKGDNPDGCAEVAAYLRAKKKGLYKGRGSKKVVP